MPSGTAVSASATLCAVSDSSATEPDSTTMTAWASAVAPSAASEIHSARMPSREASIAESTLSALSWECGIDLVPQPLPPAAGRLGVLVMVGVLVVVVIVVFGHRPTPSREPSP